MKKLKPSREGLVVSLDEARRNIEQYRRDGESEAARMIQDQRAHMEQRRIESMLGRAGIPDRFKDRAFGTFNADTDKKQRVLRTCRLYADRFESVRKNGSCLMLLGGVGTGKTHLAASILHSVLERGYTGMYYRVSDALRFMRSVFSRDDLTEQDVLDTLTGCDLLVLDEVGVAIGDAEKRRAMLYDVLDTRYAEVKPTVLLSNMDAGGIEEYLGARLYDRLMEDGGVALEFTWGSYRRAHAKS